MELTDVEEKAVKTIYSNYHAGELNADEALHTLERVINGEEICPDCLADITDDNPLIDETRYSTQFGSCVGCCDPTP